MIKSYVFLSSYLRTGCFAKAKAKVRVNTFQSGLNFFGASLADMLGSGVLLKTSALANH